MSVLTRIRKNASAGRLYDEWEQQRGVKTCVFCLERMTFAEAKKHRCTPARQVLRAGTKRARKLKKVGGLQILE